MRKIILKYYVQEKTLVLCPRVDSSTMCKKGSSPMCKKRIEYYVQDETQVLCVSKDSSSMFKSRLKYFVQE